MTDNDIAESLQNQVSQAIEKNEHLIVRAGGSKDFYGRSVEGNELNIAKHQGIINYEPTELVITARAGTPLKTIEKQLSDNNQMLAFEPPRFSNSATLGGTIACNLSGPRRAYSGAARDYVLGTKIINGKAEILSFGGEVMKNVAGYDVSRLMAGSMGTLGVLLEVSLKVVPRPETEITLVQNTNIKQALENLHHWSNQGLPITASCFHQGQLSIRLSGTEKTINTIQQSLGGEILSHSNSFWHSIKEQSHIFFDSKKTLWRISLASNSAVFSADKETLYEWGGALRWVKSDSIEDQSPDSLNGHISLFRSSGDRDKVFQALPKPILQIHRHLKQAFDPHGIFNIGRMYPEI